jgi:tetratricopeptide (TPR) repeat protein
MNRDLEAAPQVQSFHQETSSTALRKSGSTASRTVKSILLGSVIVGTLGTGLGTSTAFAQPSPNLLQQANTASQNCLDQVYQQAGAQAVPVCQQAVTLNQTIGNRRIEAYSLGNLGTLYLQQQDYQQAAALYQQALNIAEKINDAPLKIKSLIALGTVYSHLNQPQRALAYYQTGLTIAEAVGDQTGISVAYYNLGLMYDGLGQYQSAVDAYSNAATIATAANDPILSGYALGKLKLAQTLSQSSQASQANVAQ